MKHFYINVYITSLELIADFPKAKIIFALVRFIAPYNRGLATPYPHFLEQPF